MPYRFLDFELDPSRYQLQRAGAQVPIRPQTFDLILLLIRHRDRPVSKKEILSSLWRGRAVTDASLTHAIARARKALGDTPEDQSIIKTVHGRGYWWVAETAEEETTTGGGRRPFVGRTGERRALDASLEEARRGIGSLVLVVGEAGAGKSRLVELFCTQAERDGVPTLKACCEDLQPTPPFYLWRQLLRQIEDSKAGSLPARLMSLAAARVFPAETEQKAIAPDAEASAESAGARAALYDDLMQVVRTIGAGRAVLIVLEDIHKADIASLQALIHVAGLLSNLGVLVVATQRPGLLAAGERIRTELARLPRASASSTVLLNSLSRSEVRTLLAELNDPRVPTTATDLVFDASAGNPFLLWQIVGIARFRAGLRNQTDLTNLPTAVRAAIALHVDELRPEHAEALRVASVVGRSFDARVLTEVLGQPLSQVSRAIAAGEEAGIIRSRGSGRFEFVHSLVHDALYEETDLHNRAQIHWAAGRAMLSILGADVGDHLPSIAVHFREARLAGAREHAATLFERCGTAALRDLAFGDAACYFKDALDLVREDTPRDTISEIRLLLAIGTARLCAGDRGGARSALEEAADLSVEINSSRMLAEAALRLSPSVLSLEAGLTDPLLISLLERALGLVGEDDLPLRVEIAGRLALALYYSDADHRRAELVAYLRNLPATAQAARLRGLLLSLGADWGPDSLDRRLLTLDEIRNEPGPSHESSESVARVFRISSFLEVGDLAAMHEEQDLLESELQALGEPYGAWYPKMFHTCRALMHAQFDEAVTLSRQYFELGKKFGDANVTHAFAAQTAEVLWMRGAARAALEGSRALADQFSSMTEWRAILAFFHALCGEHEEAEQLVERLGQSGFRSVRRNLSWTLAICSLSEVVARLNLRRWAPVLFELLYPYRGRNAVAGFGVISWGSVSRFLGQLAGSLGRWDEAQALLEEAVRDDSLAGAASWIARSEVSLALLLHERGDAALEERARRIARRVWKRARGLGMLQLERDLEAVGLVSR